MLDKNKTEEIAVTAVQSVFAQVEGVLVHLKTEDKMPYIDGYLAVYKEDTDHKENLVGNIDVQVKGRASKQVKGNSPRLSIPVADLRKYRDVYGGVLFFLVGVGNDCKSRGIFYKQLLPYDIAKILRGVEDAGKKTVTVRFKAVPVDDPFLLRKLCMEFLDNRNKQHDINCIRIGGSDGHPNETVKFVRYELGSRLSDVNDPSSLRTWEGETYEYGVTENGQRFTLGKIEDVAEIGLTGPAEISSGDYAYQVDATLGEDGEGRLFKFGSFEFRFGPNAKVNYKPKGTFLERLRDAQLLKEILKTEALMLNGQELFRGIAFADIPIDELEANIEALKEFERLAQGMNIQIDWDPSKLSDYELSELGRLIDSVVHSKPVPLNGIDEDPVNLNMDIQGARIKVIAKRTDDGLYDLIDLLHGNIVAYVPGAQDGDGHRPEEGVPGLFILNREDLRMAANLDSVDLENAFRVLPTTEETAPLLNYKLLEMLSAYDEGAVCGEQLLNCAELVANQLLEVEPESEIYFINLAQVQKRRDKLSESMITKLRRIALDSEDEMVKICAFLLLDQQEFANDILTGLPESKREEFFTEPIARFMKSSSALSA